MNFNTCTLNLLKKSRSIVIPVNQYRFNPIVDRSPQFPEQGMHREIIVGNITYDYS
jgi:hypothetical protein